MGSLQSAGTRRAVLVALAASIATVALSGGAVAAEAPPTYRPPVSAPVVDGFRPPAHRYGPGNRGLEYGTAPGTEVQAAAPGRVTFAGLVAGGRHVTVLHEDGLRTTYSFLATIDVVVGQRVRQGDRVGTTAGHLHFSARAGDAYLDPASLFATGPPKVRLVPFDEPPGDGPGGERSAISQLVGGLGGLGGALGGAVGATLRGAAGLGADGAAWLRDSSGQLVRTAWHYARYRVPVIALVDGAATLVRITRTAWDISHRPCTAAGTPIAAPAARRVAVLVAGLGSTSESGAIDDVDVVGLGYEQPDVLRFSYSGGRTPSTGLAFPDLLTTRYGKPESQHDLLQSALLLADLLEQVAERAPDAPVDILAHSQGGLVTRLALLELEARHGLAWLERLGTVITLATPHGGADLATAGFALVEGPLGPVVQAVDAVHDLPLDPDAPSARQLSETSAVAATLAEAGVPEPVELVSIGAREDYVVPVPRTAVAGETQVVVDLGSVRAHDALPGSAEAHREMALALAGAPPTCRSFGAAFTDQLFGEAISDMEDRVGAALLGVG